MKKKLKAICVDIIYFRILMLGLESSEVVQSSYKLNQDSIGQTHICDGYMRW